MAGQSVASGTAFEGRLQRLALAQGVFAERGLCPAATSDHRMLATDVDVLASEYRSTFHVARCHYECKTGKINVLDRVLWLAGLRHLLSADGSVLCVRDCDTTIVGFARTLGVEILTESQLCVIEAAVKIGPQVWPARSRFDVYVAAVAAWQKRWRPANAGNEWNFLKEILGFIQVDSWQSLEYRHLNRLTRYLSELPQTGAQSASDADAALCCAYAIAGLCVRLSQYLLAICYDIAPLAQAEARRFLTDRLIFGGHNPIHARSLVGTTVEWIKHSAQASGTSVGPELNIDRLFAQPNYADDLFDLVWELFTNANEARFLPLACEVHHFDCDSASTAFPQLTENAGRAKRLLGLLHGFVIRAFAVPKALLEPIGDRLQAHYAPRATKRSGKAEQQELLLQSQMDESETEADGG